MYKYAVSYQQERADTGCIGMDPSVGLLHASFSEARQHSLLSSFLKSYYKFVNYIIISESHFTLRYHCTPTTAKLVIFTLT